MKIIHVRILCIFLSLYFNVGSSRWMRRRITFAHASNGSLVVSTPPPITTQSPPVETRMEITTEADRPIQKNTTQFLRGSEKFSFDILHAISGALQDYDANFVLSPFSIWSVMVLIAEGASDNSFKQLEEVLHLPSDLRDLRAAYTNVQQLLSVNTTTVEVGVNQMLFSDANRALENGYVQILTKDYRADHFRVNFEAPDAAANAINNHISFRTHGKIQNIVTPEELIQIHLVLASTVYFRGEWKFKFKKNQTKDLPFYDENEKFIANVPMMSQQHSFRSVAIDPLKATIVELPYGTDDRFSMLLMQPYATLNEVFDSLRRYDVAKIHQALSANVPDEDDEEDGIVVTMPKFKIDSDLDLRTVFEHLGAVDIFYQSKANLSRMTDDELHVSHVFHKAIIDVDETGTVAAAVTVAELNFRMRPQEFIFNRPFGFLITDRTTNTLLFGGQVRNPLLS